MRAQALDRLRQAIEAFAQLGQAGARGIRQFQRPVVAMKELDIEIFLERADLMTDRCRRHIELDCGFFHTQMARRGLKGLERIQRGQALGHDCYSA